MKPWIMFSVPINVRTTAANVIQPAQPSEGRVGVS
jgi:hypothetical protein